MAALPTSGSGAADDVDDEVNPYLRDPTAFQASACAEGHSEFQFIPAPNSEPSPQSIVDSGTNIHVCSLRVYEQLRRLNAAHVLQRKSPINDLGRVKFGKNDAVAEIVLILKGGGLIDWFAVVEGIDVCLTSVLFFTTKRNMDVTFSGSIVNFLYNNRVILQGHLDEALGMCIVDMLELVTAIDPRLDESQQELAAMTARKVQRFKAQAIAKCLRLHRHLNCLPFETMAPNISSGAWKVDPEVTAALCVELGKRKLCVACALTRWRQVTHEGSGIPVSVSAQDVGKVIFFDLEGKINPASEGVNFMGHVGCVATKMSQVHGQRSKEESILTIRKWIIWCLQHGKVPQYLMIDRGSDAFNALADEAYARYGIKALPMPAKLPAGHAERKIQTVLDDIKAVLTVSPFLNATDWLPIAKHAVKLRNFCRNTCSDRIDPSKCPEELFTGKPPSLEAFDEAGVGDFVVVATPAAESSIYQPRNQLGLVTAVSTDGSKGVDLRIPGKSRTLSRGHHQKINVTHPLEPRSVDVAWNEDHSEAIITASHELDLSTPSRLIQYQDEAIARKLKADEAAVANARDRLSDVENEVSIRDQIVRARRKNDKSADKEGTSYLREGDQSEEPTYFYDNSPTPSTSIVGGELAGDQDSASDDGSTMDAGGDEYIDDEADAFVSSHAPRSANSFNDETSSFWAAIVDNPSMFKSLHEQTVWDLNLHFATFGHFPDLPPPLDFSIDHELLSLPHYTAFAAKWKNINRDYDKSPTLGMVMRSPELQLVWGPAMRKEAAGWTKTSTKIHKDRALQIGISPHVTLFKTKAVDNLKKARITIDGGFQLKSTFRGMRHQLFAPAMDSDLALYLLSFATYFSLRHFSSDVTQCFTQNTMADATYPRSLVVHLNEFECGEPGGAFYELDCVIYGCPDASMEWHKRLRAFLLSLGFSVSVYHPCLFILPFGPFSIIVCGIATDNIEFFFTDNRDTEFMLEEIVAAFSSKWPMTHEEEAANMLGLAIDRHADGSKTITQPGTVKQVESLFFPDGRAPMVLVPEMPGYRTPSPEALAPADVKRFQSALGTIVFSRCTRNDMKPMMSMLAEHNQSPRLIDEAALHHLAAYYVTTRTVGLRFLPASLAHPRPDIRKPIPMHAFSDASWNANEDGTSRIGRCLYHGPFPTYSQQQQGPISAPFFAKSGKEKGVISSSVAQAELKSAVLTLADIQINRGQSEEIAGIANSSTLEDVPPGADTPTQLRAHASNKAIADFLHAPPTPLAQDNLSVVISSSQDTSKRGQKMRHLARPLQALRSAAVEGLIEVISVPAAEQRANLLTKNLLSPVAHWRAIEVLQGSQIAIEHFRKQAKLYGELKKSPKQLGKTVVTSIATELQQSIASPSDTSLERATAHTTAFNTITNAKAFIIWPDDLRNNRPSFRFYIRPPHSSTWKRICYEFLRVNDCSLCLLHNPPKRTPTVFGLCIPCGVEHHSLMPDFVMFYDKDGRRIHTLGMRAMVDLTTPVIDDEVVRREEGRHLNPQIWSKHDIVGTRIINHPSFPTRPAAQPQPATYGGVQRSVAEMEINYTSQCIGPYVMQVRNNTYIDAAWVRGFLTLCNHAEVGTGAGNQANCKFRPPANNSIVVTAKCTEAVYHGDIMFAHYANRMPNFNLDLPDGTAFRHETS